MTAENIQTLDATLANILNDRQVPLASLVAVALRGGQVVYSKAFGFTQHSSRTPVDVDSLFRVASISKTITAIGALALADQGALELDRDISDYLGYPVRNPHFSNSEITARMLMCHTSSLRDDAGYFFEAPARLRDLLTPGGALHGKGGMWARNAQPGAFFNYANLPWGVLASVIERITNERFDRYIARAVLTLLGIDGGFHPADFSPSTLRRTATLYRKRVTTGGQEVWRPQGDWMPQVDDYASTPPVSRARSGYEMGANGTLMSPQGGARVSAMGLAKIARMIHGRGAVDGVRVLSPRAVEVMVHPQWKFDEKLKNGDASYEGAAQLFNAWGLGVQLYRDASGPASGDRVVKRGGFTPVGHFGDAYGLTSAMLIDPKTGDGMIFIVGGVGADPATQRGQYSAYYRYEERVLDALYEHAVRAPGV